METVREHMVVLTERKSQRPEDVEQGLLAAFGKPKGKNGSQS
jgi:hypothetical protein